MCPAILESMYVSSVQNSIPSLCLALENFKYLEYITIFNVEITRIRKLINDT